MTKAAKREAIYNDMMQFIADIIGEDVVEELEVSEASVFTKDLEMDSIEIVSFAEKVKAKYGEGIDFAGWLSSMSIDELIALSIGDIVNFIADADA
jgi:Phosphopantetheine attachment site.